MSIDIVANYIKDSLSDPSSAWDIVALRRIATNEIPPIIFRDRQTLLKADQARLWIRWFLEGLVSPWSFIDDTTKEELHLFEIALKKINLLYPMDDLIQKRELANVVANQLFKDIKRRREASGRDFATKETKRVLIEEATPPRCYLCGFEFSEEAIDAFLKVSGRDPVSSLKMVDIFRPRLIERDLKIEIEHVVPVAEGGQGQGNLRLACGWCNRHKSDKTSIYDASFGTSKIGFRVGPYTLYELPEPFWQIRLLGVHSRCQHADGCGATTKDGELYLAFRDWDGSPNPTNLGFYCSAHDPIAAHRFIAEADAIRIWEERTKS